LGEEKEVAAFRQSNSSKFFMRFQDFIFVFNLLAKKPKLEISSPRICIFGKKITDKNEIFSTC